MSIVVVAEFEGGSQELYEQVSAKVFPDGQLPDGQKVHIAGAVEGGWRVITVWDSKEQHQQFVNERLIPAMQESGQAPPKIQPNPVHRVITA